MPTFTFAEFLSSATQFLGGSQLSVSADYDASVAYAFEITDDDASWSGDLASNNAADDTSQQTTTVRDENRNVVASGQTYLQSSKNGG